MCLLPSASLQSHTAALTHFQTGLRAVVRELWSLAKLHQNQTKKTTIKTSLVESILMEKFPFLNGSLYTHLFLCRLRKMHWILTIKTVLFLKKNKILWYTQMGRFSVWHENLRDQRLPLPFLPFPLDSEKVKSESLLHNSFKKKNTWKTNHHKMAHITISKLSQWNIFFLSLVQTALLLSKKELGKTRKLWGALLKCQKWFYSILINGIIELLLVLLKKSSS